MTATRTLKALALLVLSSFAGFGALTAAAYVVGY